jgi:hypothetical protein
MDCRILMPDPVLVYTIVNPIASLYRIYEIAIHHRVFLLDFPAAMDTEIYRFSIGFQV